jgi:hypothetical protein
VGAAEQRELAALAQDALTAIGLNGGEILTLECLWRLAVSSEERDTTHNYFIPGFLRVPIDLELLARWRRKGLRTIQLQMKKFDSLGFFYREASEMESTPHVSVEAVELRGAPGVYVIGPFALVRRLHQRQDVRNALFEMQPALYASDSYDPHRRIQFAPIRMFGLPSPEEQADMVRRSKAHFSALSASRGAA